MWWLPLATTGISALTSAIGTGSTNRTNLQAVRETNQAQMQLAEYQYEKNLEQWHRENAYNDPAAQMQRLANAGLNPYLAYSNGNAIHAAAQSPSYDAPNLQAYQQKASPWNDIADAIDNKAAQAVDLFLREKKQAAEIESLKYDNSYKQAMIDKTNREKALDFYRALGMRQDYESKKIFNKYYEAQMLSSLGNAQAQFENTVANTAVLEEQVDAVRAEVVAKEAAANLSNAQADAARKLIQKYQKEIEALAADIALKGEQANLARQQALFTQIQAEWTEDHGPGKTWVDSLFNLPNMALSSVIKFAKRIGVYISDGLNFGLSDKSKVNVTSPFTIGLKGFSTLAPGKAGAVDGFRLR